MSAKHTTCWLLTALLALGFLGAVQAPARAADDDAALREQALKLNDVTGEDATKAAIQSLLKSPTNTKKMIAVAAKIVKEKEKDQPFEVNATYILAHAAQGVRDYEAAETFYKLFGQQAGELKSVSKMVQAYLGMSGLMFET